MNAGGGYCVETHDGNASVSVSLIFEREPEIRYLRTPRNVSYAYLPNGDRISRTNDSGTTYYLYDREDMIAILNRTGVPIRAFLHGPGTDEPVAMKIGSDSYYYAQDGLGSTVALINVADGTIAAAYRYDAWGNIINHTGIISEQNPYLFTGREYDWQTGIYYYRARSYDAQLGRFLQRDPAGMVDGPNMYAYVGNDPVNKNDESGKYPGWAICSAYGAYQSQVAGGISRLQGGLFWRGHFFVGCELRRIYCFYWDVVNIAYAYEVQAYLRDRRQVISMDDVRATVWGYYYGTYGGYNWWQWRWYYTCDNLAVKFIPQIDRPTYNKDVLPPFTWP